jgi:hypothetical protein
MSTTHPNNYTNVTYTPDNREVIHPYLGESFTMQACGRDVELTTRKYPAYLVRQALKEIITDGLTMTKASEKFGIKRPTLYFYFKKLYPDPVEFHKKLSHLL